MWKIFIQYHLVNFVRKKWPQKMDHLNIFWDPMSSFPNSLILRETLKNTCLRYNTSYENTTIFQQNLYHLIQLHRSFINTRITLLKQKQVIHLFKHIIKTMSQEMERVSVSNLSRILLCGQSFHVSLLCGKSYFENAFPTVRNLS